MSLEEVANDYKNKLNVIREVRGETFKFFDDLYSSDNYSKYTYMGFIFTKGEDIYYLVYIKENKELRLGKLLLLDYGYINHYRIWEMINELKNVKNEYNSLYLNLIKNIQELDEFNEEDLSKKTLGLLQNNLEKIISFSENILNKVRILMNFKYKFSNPQEFTDTYIGWAIQQVDHTLLSILENENLSKEEVYSLINKTIT